MNVDIDKQRVTLLLNINTLIIQKCLQIQQQQQQQGSAMNPKLQSILQDLMKRLHANLTCMGDLSDKHNTGNISKVVFPQILTPPADMIDLNELYTQLQKLFPEGVHALQRRSLQMRQEQIRREGQPQPLGQPQGQPQGQQFW